MVEGSNVGPMAKVSGKDGSRLNARDGTKGFKLGKEMDLYLKVFRGPKEHTFIWSLHVVCLRGRVSKRRGVEDTFTRASEDSS